MADSSVPSQEEPTPKKVAIVGAGPTRRRAPFSDPSWEIWAFSSKLWRFPRISRWFEIHAITDLRQQLATRKPGRRSYGGYIRFMRRLECPVYMAKEHPSIPQSVVYPIQEVLDEFGRIFTSTASYMIALAIMEGYDVIGLWGVDTRWKEYRRQRRAIRYLLWLARQKGIELQFPRNQAISIPKNPRLPRTRVLYAYDWRSRGAWWRDRVRRRLRRTRAKRRLHP